MGDRVDLVRVLGHRGREPSGQPPRGGFVADLAAHHEELVAREAAEHVIVGDR